VIAAMKDLLDQVRRCLTGRPRRVPADPFRTLELQARLSRLSREIELLDLEPAPRFALGHHAQAAIRAYDQTLADACRLQGLPTPDGNGATDRLLAEAALSQAGWTW